MIPQPTNTDVIYERYHDGRLMDEIRHNRLRWAEHLIYVDESNLAWKSNIYEDMAKPASDRALMQAKTAIRDD